MVQYSAGFGQLGVHDGTVLLARHDVPVQLHVHGPEPETPLAEPKLQSSDAVEGVVDLVVPLALPQTPGERLALQALLPHVQEKPILYPPDKRYDTVGRLPSLQRPLDEGPDAEKVPPLAEPQVMGAAAREAEQSTDGDDLLKHVHVTVAPGAGKGTLLFPTVGDEPVPQRRPEYAVSV